MRPSPGSSSPLLPGQLLLHLQGRLGELLAPEECGPAAATLLSAEDLLGLAGRSRLLASSWQKREDERVVEEEDSAEKLHAINTKHHGAILRTATAF